MEKKVSGNLMQLQFEQRLWENEEVGRGQAGDPQGSRDLKNYQGLVSVNRAMQVLLSSLIGLLS